MKTNSDAKTVFKPTQHTKKGDQHIGTANFNKPAISFFTDASVLHKTIISGYGITDETLIVSFRQEIKTQNNNLAELIAIHQAISIAIMMELKDLEIFTDSLPAIELIRKYFATKKTSDIFSNKLKTVTEDLSKFETFRIHWIPRHRNILADAMSKEDFSYENFL